MPKFINLVLTAALAATQGCIDDQYITRNQDQTTLNGSVTAGSMAASINDSGNEAGVIEAGTEIDPEEIRSLLAQEIQHIIETFQDFLRQEDGSPLCIGRNLEIDVNENTYLFRTKQIRVSDNAVNTPRISEFIFYKTNSITDYGYFHVGVDGIGQSSVKFVFEPTAEEYTPEAIDDIAQVYIESGYNPDSDPHGVCFRLLVN